MFKRWLVSQHPDNFYRSKTTAMIWGFLAGVGITWSLLEAYNENKFVKELEEENLN